MLFRRLKKTSEGADVPLPETVAVTPGVADQPPATEPQADQGHGQGQRQGQGELRVHQVCKTFKRRPVVRGASLHVRQGEAVGVLGPNGAGKTTTMKMAMALIQPTAGEVKLFGHAIGDASVRARVGYLPEHPYFYDYLTAA